MNEQQFARQIRKHLERGLHDLPQATTDRLAQAHRIALAHQKQAVVQSSLATAGSFLNIHPDVPRHYNQLIAALALVAAAVLTTFWLADRQVIKVMDDFFDVLIVLTKTCRCNVFTELFKPVIT